MSNENSDSLNNSNKEVEQIEVDVNELDKNEAKLDINKTSKNGLNESNVENIHTVGQDSVQGELKNGVLDAIEADECEKDVKMVVEENKLNETEEIDIDETEDLGEGENINAFLQLAIQNIGNELNELKAQDGKSQELILKSIKELNSSFDAKIKYDESQQGIIDRLHKDLQGYKEDLVFKILRPMVMDIISLYDDMGKFHKIFLEKPEKEQSMEKLLKRFMSDREMLEDILYKHGVDSFSSNDDFFDPKQHRSLKTDVTNDPEKDKTISKRVKKGFRYEERIIRPEIVCTYSYNMEQEVEDGEQVTKE